MAREGLFDDCGYDFGEFDPPCIFGKDCANMFFEMGKDGTEYMMCRETDFGGECIFTPVEE